MFIIDILQISLELFLEMAPYLIFGLLFVGILNIWMTKEIVAKHIGKNNFTSILKAALFGVPLPLCSCGVVPSAVYMSNNGASKPATVSFLISTPQTGIDSIIATYGMLGPVFAVFRPVAAFLMGIFGGLFVKLFSKEVQQFPNFPELGLYTPKVRKNSEFYIRKGLLYPFVEFLDDISSQFITGLIIAAIITYLVPEDFFAGSAFSSGLLGMLLMVILSIPMYVCATASIPIAIALMMKGFSPGIAFVFLAAGPATNAASLTILSNALGKKVTLLFVLSISFFSILFGLLLDRIFNIFEINPHLQMSHSHDHSFATFGIFEYSIGTIFLILLMMSIYRKYFRKFITKRKSNQKPTEMKLIIEGMTCNHCAQNVRNALVGIGIASVRVVPDDNTAYVSGKVDLEKVKEAVEKIGYKFIRREE